MKIVMLCDFFNENYQYQENLLAKHYKKLGYEVTIVSALFDNVFDYMQNNYKDTGKQEKSFTDYKLIKLPYLFNIFGKLRKYGGIIDLLTNENPDIIFVHNIHLNLIEVAKYKKKYKNVKVLMDYHGDFGNSANNLFSRFILHGFLFRFLLLLTRREIDKIYFVTPGSCDFLEKVYKINKKDMALLPLCADNDLIKEKMAQNTRSLIRNKYGFTDKDFVIFTGGKINSLKKTHLLLESFSHISDQNLFLFMVGEVDSSEPEYKNLIEELIQKIGTRLILLGWLSGDDIYNCLLASDIAVFPASQSVLWQQAISCGLPLIVGESFGQGAEYLNIYNCMIIFPSDRMTSANLKLEIERLKCDNLLYAKMKENAWYTAHELLSYDKVEHLTIQ